MEAGADKQQQQQQQQQQQSQPENLLLSFENPNYQFEKQLKSMDQARIDDHLNSNIEPNMYEELCKELKLYTELSGKQPHLTHYLIKPFFTPSSIMLLKSICSSIVVNTYTFFY